MSKYGNVLTYKNCEEAKNYIGKRCAFFNTFRRAEEFLTSTNNTQYANVGILEDIKENNNNPFVSGKFQWQFLVPIIKDEELMTYEELVEWEAKGFGVHTYTNETWGILGCYDEKERKQQVDERYRIRHHGYDEILKPTKAIFLKDCRGGKENG